MTRRLEGEGVNPSGLCQCGCGQPTGIAKRSITRRGWIIGKPKKYCGHHRPRSSPVDFIETGPMDCWEWQLTVNECGYGITSTGRKKLRAHRWYYERYIGPIREGLHIDHLCNNRRCVNPGHLEAVTQSENNRRAWVVRRANMEAKNV